MKIQIYLMLMLIALSFACNPPKADFSFDDTFARAMWENHEKYLSARITHRRFKHQDLQKILDGCQDAFRIRTIGYSVGGKAIRMVSLGSGETSILLWSQMHGDEPTATMAIADLLSFFADTLRFQDERRQILEKLTIHFIPMLNPDGADLYQRRNLQGIDINRDALRLQTPEGRLLKHVRDSLKADWGFNLHDQGRDVSLGDKPASISFLAPAYDFDRSVNDQRADAMKLISLMNLSLQKYIPESVGRYWDDFEPRAFGDNIQRWGTRTILIESGGATADREKQTLRKANFMIIMQAMLGIANKEYAAIDVNSYDQIPVNERKFNDHIIKNLKIPVGDTTYVADLAYRFQEVENEGVNQYFLSGRISDIGDLSTSYSYQYFDAMDFELSRGKLYNSEYADIKSVMRLSLIELMKDGYTDFKVSNAGDRFEYGSLPIKIVNNQIKMDNERINIGDNPSYILARDGVAQYALVNGMIIDLSMSLEDIIRDLEKY